MVKEAYVSFETAKLLKENGFDTKCISYYSDSTTSAKLTFGGRVNYNNDSKWKYKMLPPISAPTQQMAMRWLREIYNLFISPRVQNDGTYICYLYDTKSNGIQGYDKNLLISFHNGII